MYFFSVYFLYFFYFFFFNDTATTEIYTLSLHDALPICWLVISHGVGAMRKYCIGAFLLDRDDPTKVIGRLREPLIKPDENEREGYVPNVVYSCGSLVHNGQLIIPYAMSDYATTFATLPLDEVLEAMEHPAV